MILLIGIAHTYKVSSLARRLSLVLFLSLIINTSPCCHVFLFPEWEVSVFASCRFPGPLRTTEYDTGNWEISQKSS